MGFQERLDPVGAGDRVGHEMDGLYQSVVGLGATEAQKPSSRLPKTLASEARDTQPVSPAH